MPANDQTRLVAGQPSWRLRTDAVELFVTERGGHLGPVTFNLEGRRIQPFSVAPWATEREARRLPPVLRALRGDFFCLPFGGNATPCGGEVHPVHGEVANGRWRVIGGGDHFLRARLRPRVRRGMVEKTIRVVPGQTAVYCRHVVSEMQGRMCFGHHAMLRFPEKAGSGVISTSRFVHGQVFVEPTEVPENRGYSMLRAGAEFTSLDAVPTVTGGVADVGRFPARRGFEDIAMLVADPELPLAWSAVVFPAERYVWFALKDPRVLRGTVLWISNGGRHYPPWNGRHINVLALEEVTAYFHYGLAESVRDNAFTRRGWPTCVELNPEAPLTVNYVMAVAPAPKGFDRVKDIRFDSGGGSVTLVAESGKSIQRPLDWGFLREGAA